MRHQGKGVAIRREDVFAVSEETLWKCFSMAKELRLRPEVEGATRKLVTFRTKWRAILDSGLPQVHVVITTLREMSMPFGLLIANDISMVDVFAAHLCSHLALLILTYALTTGGGIRNASNFQRKLSTNREAHDDPLCVCLGRIIHGLPSMMSSLDRRDVSQPCTSKHDTGAYHHYRRQGSLLIFLLLSILTQSRSTFVSVPS